MVCYFADGSLSARGGKDMYVVFSTGSACERLDFGARIRRTTRKADCAEKVYIIDVIADETDLVQCDAEPIANLLRRPEFGLTVRVDSGTDAKVQEGEFQFLRTGFDDRAVLGSENTTRDPRLLQTDHAHAVIDTEAFEGFAVGGIKHPTVREATINIREE